MSQCTQQMCRGGISCCKYDPVISASYCLTQTYCNPNTSTTGFVIILLIMILALIGAGLVLYLRWRSLVKDTFTMANFVDREMQICIYLAVTSLKMFLRGFQTISSKLLFRCNDLNFPIQYHITILKTYLNNQKMTKIVSL